VTRKLVGLCGFALVLGLLILGMVSIQRVFAGNLWELDGQPDQFSGHPGSVVDVTFGVHYIGPQQSADFSKSGFSVTDTKAPTWIWGEMSVPTNVPHCEWRTLHVSILIPIDAKPGDMDTVRLSVPDPVSLNKTVLVVSSVGGLVVPVDKLGLLAPYIGLASTILVGAAVATTIYVRRKKEKR
jgi:hypothetical protein